MPCHQLSYLFFRNFIYDGTGMDADTLKELALSRGIVLIYGAAGSGKTNLVLWLLSKISGDTPSRNLFYISTEGSSYVHLLNRYRFGTNTYFINVVNISHLLDTVLDIYYSKDSIAAVAVDTINNFYRTEVLESTVINRLLNTVMALLAYIHRSSNSYIIITAQVKEAGELSFSGESVLSFWTDVIAYTRKIDEQELGSRELIFETPNEIAGLTLKFKIGDEGVELLGTNARHI
ncbi:MAG: hypothetical protein J7J20_02440 [Desulfurococcales archaeon]|nr:hypothetical protein [Desulfurococcales archaeon]